MNVYVVDRTDNLIYSDRGASIIAQGPAIPPEISTAYRVTSVAEDLARRAGLRVWYEGKDITVDIAPWLLSADFSDGLESADDLQLTLWDDGRWESSWAPDEGARLDVEILVVEQGETVRMLAGSFAIDEVEYTGPPSVVSIKATSAFITSALRREKKTRAWEKVSLQQIAETIATKANLKLLYSARNNPIYSRMDQKSRSDLDFLAGLAEREGLRVKVSDDQLIVYSQTEFDAAPTVDVFNKSDLRICNYRFSTGVTEAYNKAVVIYRVPNTKKTLEHTYIPDDAPETGQTLRINERVESVAEAERVARNRLMAANRGVIEASLTLVGDVRMLAGQNIDITGYGKNSGRYAIEEAGHSLWPYRTNLRLRKI